MEENNSVCPVCGKDNAAEEVTEVEKTEGAAAEEVAAVETEVEEKMEETTQGEGAQQANAEAPQAEKKLSSGKLTLIVTAVIVVLAILIAAIASGMKKPEAQTEDTMEVPDSSETVEVETVPPTIPADGNPDDVTCKGSYTASDEEVIAAKANVVATAGDAELTLGQLQLYYWMQVREFLGQFASYAEYLGFDYTQGLDVQLCSMTEETMTWQQYFLDGALGAWQTYASMEKEAEKNGTQMSAQYQEMLDSMAEELNANAVANGFADGTEVLHKSLGGSVEMEDYLKFMEVYYRGYSYFETQTGALQEPTEEELEAFFAEHAEGYEESGITKDSKYVDVRHVLIMPEVAEGEAEATEEAWAAAEARAQELMDEWLAGKADEDAFAAMANEQSQDPGSNTTGGLYTDVYEGQMVPAFNDWCFDESRAYGDYGIVETNYGYHIMFYVGGTPIWQNYARNDMLQQQTNDFIDNIRVNYPLNVDYQSIILTSVEMQ